MVSTPAARRSAGATATRCATTRWPILSRPATAWHVARPLDLAAMRLACDPLYGEHDFSSFCRRPPVPGASLVRVVRDARWVDLGDGMLRFEIEASSFCQQMVRAIVGTMVDVGLGSRKPGTWRPWSGPGRGPRPASWLRPTACACGRSPTRSGAAACRGRALRGRLIS